MKKHCLLFLLFVLPVAALAQCTQPVIQIADSSCSGTPITFGATSTPPAFTASWDFQSGDLENTPTGFIAGTYPALLSSLGFDIGNDNGNYIGFNISSAGELTRYNFGSDLSNVPVFASLGNPVPAGYDLRIYQAGGNWYGFVTTLFYDALYRLDFGNSLLNTPVSSVVSVPGGTFNWPFQSSITENNGNYYGIVSSYLNGTIALLDFGNSPGNTPTASVITVLAGQPAGVALARDCDKWVAYVEYASSTWVTRINFIGAPTSANATITLQAFSSPAVMRKMDMVAENGKWYLISNNVNGNEVYKISLGTDINNAAPAILNQGTVGGLHSTNSAHTIRKFGSSYYGFTTNSNTGVLGVYKYPELTSATPESSDLTNGSVSFNTNGWNNLYATIVNTATGDVTFATDSVYIKQGPVAGFTNSIGCLGTPIQFTDTSSVVGGFSNTINWDFGDTTTDTGFSVSHSFSTASVYQVSISATSDNGCTASAIKAITVAEPPQAAFAVIDSACSNTEVQFTDLSIDNSGTISTWLWTFGDGDSSTISSPLHAYQNAGNNAVQLSIASTTGCTSSTTENMVIKPSPATNFLIANTCLGETTQFTNTTQFSGTGTLSYNWDFDDGNSSSLENPQNNYPSSVATYSVTLISEAANGCIDTLDRELKTGNKPIPFFQASTLIACSGNSIQFTDFSAPASGEIISARYWDFGDNSYDSTSLNPSHVFQTPGSYLVTLTVFSPSSCDSSYSLTIQVIESPEAKYSTSNICFGDSVSFIDSSTSNASTISSWQWQFGDTQNSTIQSPMHYYTAAGTYIALLTITDAAGCFDTLSTQITVYPIPEANFGYSLACTDKSVQFTDSASVLSGITSWFWDFGDGSTSILQNPQHVYTQAQLFPVELTTTSAFGCTNNTTKFIVVKASPLFSTNVTYNCLGSAQQLQYIPGPNQNSQYGYSWDFGDSNFDVTQTTQHTYAASGNYTTTLTVVDLVSSCSRTIQDTAIVYAVPSANFLADSICAGEQIIFNDLSSSADGAIINWSWDFGNLGTSTLQNPQLSVSSAGNVNTKLSITSAFGCRDSLTKTIAVFPLPVVNFTYTPSYGTPPLSAAFTNNTGNASYSWDFGDGSATISTVNPVHLYTDTGSFTIQLTATTNKGCRDSVSRVLNVFFPLTDLSVENASYVLQNNRWILSSRLRNVGNIPINTFLLEARMDGKSVIQEESIADTILPGGFLNYVFSASFVAANETPEFLCIKAILVNGETDDNAFNNEKCAGSVSQFAILELYPVPAQSNLNIGLSIPEAGEIAMEIIDLAGKKIISDDLILPKGYQQIQLPVSSLAAGIYLLRMNYNNQEVVKRFMRY